MNELDLNFKIEIDDFEDIDIDIFNETRYNITRPKRQRTKNVAFKNAKKFANEILVEKDSRIYALIDGSFIFGDWIEAFLVKNRKCAKITLSTLSLSQENIDSFINLINAGYISELNIIVSDYFFANEKHNLVQYMYKYLDIDDIFQLSVCRTHTKITLIEFEDFRYVVSGSANLRSSDNLEQISIEENAELYDFNLKIHQEIAQEFKTINKSIKTKRLWQVVAKNTQTITEQEQQEVQQNLEGENSQT